MRTVSANGSDVPGNIFGQEFFSIPRIPYDRASAGMKAPGAVMAFDVYMIITFTILFEIIGCLLLHASIKWYGPTTRRYQVTSGNSLTKGTDVISQLMSGKSLRSNTVEPEPEKQLSIPAAPPAHLMSKDIVYEVDVPIKSEDDEKKGDKKKPEPSTAKSEAEREVAATSDPVPVDDDERVLLTARDYGQPGKGVAQEWVLKRTVGAESLSLRNTMSSAVSKSIRIESLTAAEAGTADGLEPPAPGRLRLLSGITSTFSPGTMTALMGSSGAGKTTL